MKSKDKNVIQSDSVMKYDKKKWAAIIDMRQKNYSNMLKRIKREQKISNFILMYYSVFLIINTVTSKYYSNIYNVVLAEYFGLILSIVVLVYSIVNSSANYGTRILHLENSLNELSKIKRSLYEKDLKYTVKKYNQITEKTEKRTDMDFFITIKHLCKEHDINWLTKKTKPSSPSEGKLSNDEIAARKKIKEYISDISIVLEQGKIIVTCFWYAILVFIPLILFILCFIIEK